VLHRLELFKANPTADNLVQFIEIAKQDFGTSTGQAFADWSHGIFPDGGGRVQVKPVVKPFAVIVKDGFYDLFKAAQIPLGPKQVELLEIHSLKLAKAFEDKIATGVGFQFGSLLRETVDKAVRTQLKALVEKSKEVEKDTNPPEDTDNV
jgi:hypothetical protein